MKEINSLIPGRHTPISKSLLALAGLIYASLEHSYISIDEIIINLKRSQNPVAKNITFTTVILAILILFSIGQIEMDKGLIKKIMQ